MQPSTFALVLAIIGTFIAFPIGRAPLPHGQSMDLDVGSPVEPVAPAQIAPQPRYLSITSFETSGKTTIRYCEWVDKVSHCSGSMNTDDPRIEEYEAANRNGSSVDNSRNVRRCMPIEIDDPRIAHNPNSENANPVTPQGQREAVAIPVDGPNGEKMVFCGAAPFPAKGSWCSDPMDLDDPRIAQYKVTNPDGAPGPVARSEPLEIDNPRIEPLEIDDPRIEPHNPNFGRSEPLDIDDPRIEPNNPNIGRSELPEAATEDDITSDVVEESSTPLEKREKFPGDSRDAESDRAWKWGGRSCNEHCHAYPNHWRCKTQWPPQCFKKGTGPGGWGK